MADSGLDVLCKGSQNTGHVKFLKRISLSHLTHLMSVMSHLNLDFEPHEK